MPALNTTVFYQPFIGFTYTESKWILLKFFLFWIITRTSECLMPISTVPSPTERTENGSTSTDLLNHSQANDCCRTGEWTAAQLSPWCGDCLCVLCMVDSVWWPPRKAPFTLCNTFVSIQLGTLISKVKYFTCICLAAIFERLSGLTYEGRWVKSA